MDSGTIADIKKRMAKGESAELLRNELLAKGFLEEDVNTAVNIGLTSLEKGVRMATAKAWAKPENATYEELTKEISIQVK